MVIFYELAFSRNTSIYSSRFTNIASQNLHALCRGAAPYTLFTKRIVLVRIFNPIVRRFLCPNTVPAIPVIIDGAAIIVQFIAQILQFCAKGTIFKQSRDKISTKRVFTILFCRICAVRIIREMNFPLWSRIFANLTRFFCFSPLSDLNVRSIPVRVIIPFEYTFVSRLIEDAII